MGRMIQPLHNSVNTRFSCFHNHLCHNVTFVTLLLWLVVSPILMMPETNASWTGHPIANSKSERDLADCSMGHVSIVMRNSREFRRRKNPLGSCIGQDLSLSSKKGNIVALHALLEAHP